MAVNTLMLFHYTKKWSFPLRISSVNVTKSANLLRSVCNIKFKTFYWKFLQYLWKLSVKVKIRVSYSRGIFSDRKFKVSDSTSCEKSIREYFLMDSFEFLIKLQAGDWRL